MGYTSAVAGKGGMGKTTVAALIIEVLRREGKTPILAVDADPNATLGDWLGIPCTCSIADIIEETKGLRNLPEGVSKPTHLEFQLQRTITESPGVDLLVMGRPEGPDCYCMANNMLRGYVASLAKNYKYVVIDNEAGMEHLNRKTTQDIDALLLVSDPTRIGLRTTMRIKELIDKLTFLNIRNKHLVLNRVAETEQGEAISDELSLQSIGKIPFDPELGKLELAGQPLKVLSDQSPAYQSVAHLLNKLAL